MGPAPEHAPEAATAESALKEASLARRLLALTLTFGKFGGITFGGGYAIVALLEEDLVRRKGWLTQDELFNIITVGESTPGPIAVNTATFVGYRLAGVLPLGVLPCKDSDTDVMSLIKPSSSCRSSAVPIFVLLEVMTSGLFPVFEGV